jgi:hypothetical protein
MITERFDVEMYTVLIVAMMTFLLVGSIWAIIHVTPWYLGMGLFVAGLAVVCRLFSGTTACRQAAFRAEARRDT